MSAATLVSLWERSSWRRWTRGCKSAVNATVSLQDVKENRAYLLKFFGNGEHLPSNGLGILIHLI